MRMNSVLFPEPTVGSGVYTQKESGHPLRETGDFMNRVLSMAIRRPLLLVLLVLVPRSCQAADALPSKFQRFDLNQDDELSRSEVPPAVRPQVFPRYDVNRDQQLDAQELAAFLADQRKQGAPGRVDEKTLAKHVRRVTEIEFTRSASHGRSHGKLDLYLPREKKNFPVIVFVHGGALVKGDKSALRSLGERLVLHGFGVVAVNYRLSPAVKFPSHVEDVAAAFSWVHANIGSYGGDANRLFVAGGSAGGYLVTLLSMDRRYLKKHGLDLDDIKGTVSISGLMNTAKVPRERLKLAWGGDPAVTQRASPMEYVSKDIPPMLVLFADGDTAGRKQQNRRMVAALKAAGHQDVSVKEMADRTHDSIREHMSQENDPGLIRMMRFLNRLSRPGD